MNEDHIENYRIALQMIALMIREDFDKDKIERAVGNTRIMGAFRGDMVESDIQSQIDFGNMMKQAA